MARKPRFNLPGIPQHIIQRGNNRQACFHDEYDYRHYLSDLRQAAHKNDCRVHAYVLMPNHVHLLVTPMAAHGVTHLMQDVGRRYVRYMNHRYQRTGTLWEGRYKSSLIDSEAYLLACMRYIELNPVRAGMVRQADDYSWSSYASNAQGKIDPLLTPHPLMSPIGMDVPRRQRLYRNLFRQPLAQDIVDRIREALNQELVLGREPFKDKIEKLTTRQTRPGHSGRPRGGRAEEARGDYYVLF